MFRFETRLVVIISLSIILLTGSVLIIVDKSTRLTEALEDKEENQALELKESKKHISVLKKMKKEFETGVWKRDTFTNSNVNESLIVPSPLKAINIFMETYRSTSDGRQFYKTLDNIRNTELFRAVKQLSNDRRKRILITGGAGFVGE